MPVNCGQSNSAVIHLSCKDLIAEEPVSENATIAIRTEKTFLARYINQISKENMHSIVLFARVIQVFRVSVNLIVTKHSLQQQERVKVWMLPTWSIVEDSNGGVNHFVITDH
jgi:hypothetical protein